MQELELKAMVPDADALRAALERAGATLALEGRLEDRRYDTADGALAARDHVLRLRVLRAADGSVHHASLDWKGPTSTTAEGYKLREELTTALSDVEAAAAMLRALGYRITRRIDRDVAQFSIDGGSARIERYPAMDVLVEVEGSPAGIERVIAISGLPRSAFTSESLAAFVARFETRSGTRAAIAVAHDEEDA